MLRNINITYCYIVFLHLMRKKSNLFSKNLGHISSQPADNSRIDAKTGLALDAPSDHRGRMATELGTFLANLNRRNCANEFQGGTDMHEFENEVLWTIEMLTSDNESYEFAPRDTNRKLDIPTPVMDLMFFGRNAGGAVKAISEGGLDAIEETCPALSRFAASLPLRTKFYDKIHDLMRETTARIINALDKQELAELWDDKSSHREFIETLAFIPGLNFCKPLFIEAALSSMVNTLANYEELSPEAATFALRYMENVGYSKPYHSDFVRMLEMRRKAIDVIEACDKLSDEWREKAIEALFGMDLNSEIHLTEKNELRTEELVNSILKSADPRNIAITVAWLSAIYLYTEYGDRIVDFFDIDIKDIEAEDHQEIADDENPDGLAA